MSSPQKMISAVDLVKPPQRAIEGHAPATYAVTPNNPAFLARGQRSILERGNEPEFAENDWGGYYDRQGIFKTREKNTVTYRSRFLAADLEVLKWASVLPDAAGTPQESRTWLYSYRDAAGDEIYCIWQGCKPTGATLTIVPNDPIMLEVTASAKIYTESDAVADAFVLGAGSMQAAQPPGTPLRFQDLGRFWYGSTEVNFRNLTLTTAFTQRIQDSNGSETDVYTEPASRRITGSCDVFKRGQKFNEDARAGRQLPAYFVLQDVDGVDDVSATKRYPAAGANYITVTSIIPGEYGNTLTLQIVAGAAGVGATTAKLTDKAVVVTLKHNGDTLTNIKTALDGLGVFTSEITGAEATNTNAALQAAPLAGGVDRDTKIVFTRFRWIPSNENLQESTEATIETKSFEADGLEVYSA